MQLPELSILRIYIYIYIFLVACALPVNPSTPATLTRCLMILRVCEILIDCAVPVVSYLISSFQRAPLDFFGPTSHPQDHPFPAPNRSSSASVASSNTGHLSQGQLALHPSFHDPLRQMAQGVQRVRVTEAAARSQQRCHAQLAVGRILGNELGTNGVQLGMAQMALPKNG